MKKTDNSLIRAILKRETVHGFKYLISEKTTVCEKLFWLCILSVAFVSAASLLYRIWILYGTNLARTTIVSTYYKYANIPFPSVTVCDSSRIDWFRVDNLTIENLLLNKVDLQGNESKLQNDLLNLLSSLSITQFGAPKDLNHLLELQLSRKLDGINISQLLFTAVRPCDHVFKKRCWWRTDYYNCCDLFELQKTGWGYCYSFNSDISEESKLLSLNYGLNGDKRDRWTDWNGEIRPRKTAGHGPWTGLRFSVHSQKLPSTVNVKPGIIVIVGDPSGFPFENDLFVPAGKAAKIGVWGDAVTTTDRLRRLSVSKRKCLFPGEARTLHRGYLRQNCIANCYRKFVQESCKCSMDFIYYHVNSSKKEAKHRPCQVKNLKCMAEFNYVFNNLLIEDTISYESGEPVPFCKCPDDCRSQKYIAKIATSNLDSKEEIHCDVHFERSFCNLYRTDVTFDFLDAIVFYGSIAALFLGASLLSVSELVFYTVQKVIGLLRDEPRKKKEPDPPRSLNLTAEFFRREFAHKH